jgi:hypothetical protein
MRTIFLQTAWEVERDVPARFAPNERAEDVALHLQALAIGTPAP